MDYTDILAAKFRRGSPEIQSDGDEEDNSISVTNMDRFAPTQLSQPVPLAAQQQQHPATNNTDKRNELPVAEFQKYLKDTREGQHTMPLPTEKPKQVNLPPAGYICHRCQVPGHYIHQCLVQSKRNTTGAHRVRRATGIPKSMLQVVDPEKSDEQTSGSGSSQAHLIDPQGVQVTLGRPRWHLSSNAIPQHKAGITPTEYLCGVCKQILADAVRIDCCHTNYCHACIYSYKKDVNSVVCPKCGVENNAEDALTENKYLRMAVNKYIAERNEAQERLAALMRQQKPVAAVEPSRLEDQPDLQLPALSTRKENMLSADDDISIDDIVRRREHGDRSSSPAKVNAPPTHRPAIAGSRTHHTSAATTGVSSPPLLPPQGGAAVSPGAPPTVLPGSQPHLHIHPPVAVGVAGQVIPSAPGMPVHGMLVQGMPMLGYVPTIPPPTSGLVPTSAAGIPVPHVFGAAPLVPGVVPGALAMPPALGGPPSMSAGPQGSIPDGPMSREEFYNLQDKLRQREYKYDRSRSRSRSYSRSRSRSNERRTVRMTAERRTVKITSHRLRSSSYDRRRRSRTPSPLTYSNRRDQPSRRYTDMEELSLSISSHSPSPNYSRRRSPSPRYGHRSRSPYSHHSHRSRSRSPHFYSRRSPSPYRRRRYSRSPSPRYRGYSPRSNRSRSRSHRSSSSSHNYS